MFAQEWILLVSFSSRLWPITSPGTVRIASASIHKSYVLAQSEWPNKGISIESGYESKNRSLQMFWKEENPIWILAATSPCVIICSGPQPSNYSMRASVRHDQVSFQHKRMQSTPTFKPCMKKDIVGCFTTVPWHVRPVDNIVLEKWPIFYN